MNRTMKLILLERLIRRGEVPCALYMAEEWNVPMKAVKSLLEHYGYKTI